MNFAPYHITSHLPTQQEHMLGNSGRTKHPRVNLGMIQSNNVENSMWCVTFNLRVHQLEYEPSSSFRSRPPTLHGAALTPSLRVTYSVYPLPQLVHDSKREPLAEKDQQRGREGGGGGGGRRVSHINKRQFFESRQTYSQTYTPTAIRSGTQSHMRYRERYRDKREGAVRTLSGGRSCVHVFMCYLRAVASAVPASSTWPPSWTRVHHWASPRHLLDLLPVLQLQLKKTPAYTRHVYVLKQKNPNKHASSARTPLPV
jgi:hypothetical protein